MKLFWFYDDDVNDDDEASEPNIVESTGVDITNIELRRQLRRTFEGVPIQVDHTDPATSGAPLIGQSYPYIERMTNDPCAVCGREIQEGQFYIPSENRHLGCR